jgi:hypothetical protein
MKYVVAVKRERRGQGVVASHAGQIPGVTVLGSTNPDRVLVDASTKAIAELRQRMGEFVWIEPLIEHTPMGAVRGSANPQRVL